MKFYDDDDDYEFLFYDDHVAVFFMKFLNKQFVFDIFESIS